MRYRALQEGPRRLRVRARALGFARADEASGSNQAFTVRVVKPDGVNEWDWEELARHSFVAGAWSGIATVGLLPGGAGLSGLFVVADARGRGAGAALVESASAWAVEQGAGTLELLVMETARAAIALYERMGFVRTGAVEEGMVRMRRVLSEATQGSGWNGGERS